MANNIILIRFFHMKENPLRITSVSRKLAVSLVKNLSKNNFNSYSNKICIHKYLKVTICGCCSNTMPLNHVCILFIMVRNSCANTDHHIIFNSYQIGMQNAVSALSKRYAYKTFTYIKNFSS